MINAIKHADATKIVVECNQVDGDVVVVVEDNGVGFEEHDAKLLNHYGFKHNARASSPPERRTDSEFFSELRLQNNFEI